LVDLAKMGEQLDADRFDIICATQDVILQNLTAKEAMAWVDQQIMASDSVSPSRFDLIANGQRFDFTFELTHYKRFWLEIQQRGVSGLKEKLPWIVDESNNLNFILFGGSLWKNISELLPKNREAAGVALFEYSGSLPEYTQSWQPNYLEAYKAATRNLQVVLVHPAIRSFPSIVKTKASSEIASNAAEIARQSLANVDQGLKDFHIELESRKKQFDHLADLYNTQLALEDPVRNWEEIKEDARFHSFAWLAFFIAGIIVPAIAAFANRKDILNFLREILTSQQGAFNISAVVIVLLPMLAWGWLLKHMSRGFVENRMIAMDARHRQILAKTFVGFSKAEGINMTEHDRAIILNALYRPVPPHTGDDGPPLGLIDLIRTK
jgi:hypothetical protein